MAVYHSPLEIHFICIKVETNRRIITLTLKCVITLYEVRHVYDG